MLDGDGELQPFVGYGGAQSESVSEYNGPDNFRGGMNDFPELDSDDNEDNSFRFGSESSSSSAVDEILAAKKKTVRIYDAKFKFPNQAQEITMLNSDTTSSFKMRARSNQQKVAHRNA